MACDMRQHVIQKYSCAQLLILLTHAWHACHIMASFWLQSLFFSHHYRLSNVLGSGQFGVVYRGVLVNGEGEEVEVAVKTLKEGSGEEDRVKFLQEAAIIGQFKHNNVVTMYGVVTQGEPVSFAVRVLLVVNSYACLDSIGVGTVAQRRPD